MQQFSLAPTRLQNGLIEKEGREKQNVCTKAPARFELAISCLLDRRFNQLSHGAALHAPAECKLHIHTCLGRQQKTKSCFAQRGARTHDPEIKSLMLYRLS